MGFGMTRSERATNGLRVRVLMRHIRGQRGIGVAHAIILALGVLILIFGLYLMVAAYYPAIPSVGVLIVGLVLVILGLAETFVETEYNSQGRRHP
jgi:hypothetical protein